MGNEPQWPDKRKHEEGVCELLKGGNCTCGALYVNHGINLCNAWREAQKTVPAVSVKEIFELLKKQELYEYTEHTEPQKFYLHYKPADDCWMEIAKAIYAKLNPNTFDADCPG